MPHKTVLPVAIVSSSRASADPREVLERIERLRRRLTALGAAIRAASAPPQPRRLWGTLNPSAPLRVSLSVAPHADCGRFRVPRPSSYLGVWHSRARLCPLVPALAPAQRRAAVPHGFVS